MENLEDQRKNSERDVQRKRVISQLTDLDSLLHSFANETRKNLQRFQSGERIVGRLLTFTGNISSNVAHLVSAAIEAATKVETLGSE